MTEFEIYTDGAASGNGYEGAQGGWAWILLVDGQVVRFKAGHVDNATNNICELMAVIDACDFLSHFIPEKTIIHSDSAYIINCYKQKWYKKWQANGWINSKKQPVANKELWELLIPFFENELFNFEKVTGHSNNKYNNLADKMAVDAKQENYEFNPERYIKWLT